MAMRTLSGPAFALCASLAACSGSEQSSPSPTRVTAGDDKSALRISGTIGSTADDERAAAEARLAQKVLVSEVLGVELGRTRDGVLLTARGTAPGLGYALPELRARRGGAAAADGYIEFDFVASPPDPALVLPEGTAKARQILANRALFDAQLRGVRGLRIIARTGATSVTF